MRASMIAAIRLGALAALISFLAGTAGLAQTGSSQAAQDWQNIRKLQGEDNNEYFVLIQPDRLADKAVFEQATRSLCIAAHCEVGFFSSREDIPKETTSNDFFQGRGWTGRNMVALFSQDAAGQYHQLSWNCDVVPQPFLDACLKPPHATAAERTLIAARQGSPAFGEARFGMTMAQLRDALAQHANVTKIDTKGRNRDVLRAEEKLGNRSFSAFYTLISDHLASLLLQRFDRVLPDACLQEEASIAEVLDGWFGPHDRFSYYDEAKTKSEYLWRFDSGAVVSLDNAGSRRLNCALDIFMRERANED